MREMRRKERAMSPSRAQELLSTSSYGVLSMVNVDGGGYGVPLSYAIDPEGNIFFHVAKIGHKLDNLTSDNRVTFTIIGDTQVVPEKFSTQYESVIAFGKVEILENEEERIHAARLLIEKYSPEFSIQGEAYIEKAIKHIKVLKLTVDHISAKANS